ncbi:RNA polymerase sigma factor [Streptosporangium sp. 'caverna']|uniref:RNA polymerase sigma factor n=1 Tax=Streptosporangium sp. 'caverna' TaxID=2202249 RepID=UPI000D7E8734|nr:RNA polymerase sigma factor [Streptosporangium sp. 'caverna']AWS40646.1 RNA polymerase subunit sigma-70 [Streptosporangium sp. 'caverna']
MGSPDVISDERDDASVIAQSLDDPRCFGELFRRHAPPLHRYAARRLGSDLADDIVAETFHLAFRKRDGYDPARGDALPWLWRIATNLIRRHYRSEVRLYRALARTGVDPVLENHADSVAERVTAAAVTSHLAAALAGLRKGDRDVLLLTAWGELSYRQIADVLEIPVGTVRSRLNRARTKVRNALGGTADE